MDSDNHKQNFTLLYVEDNPANLRLMQQIIKLRSGFELIHASTAEMGLEIALTQPLDLILLDLNLPGMDGYSALEQLQENKTTASVPVIAVTANAMPEEVEKGKQVGFFEYITKPIDIDMLFKTVNKALNIDKSDKRDNNDNKA